MTNHDQVRASRHQNAISEYSNPHPKTLGRGVPTTRVMGAWRREYGPAVGRSVTRSVTRTRSTGPRGAVDASDARRPPMRPRRGAFSPFATRRARDDDDDDDDAFFPSADDDDDDDDDE